MAAVTPAGKKPLIARPNGITVRITAQTKPIR